METFFLVWNPNGGNPYFKHPTAETAKAEAMRLGAQNPKDSFFVLEAIGEVTTKPVVQAQWNPAINMPF